MGGAAIAVVELEELQGTIADSQERGYMTAAALAAAVEDAELSVQQAHDLLAYLEEHGIEVLAAGESAPELQVHGTGISAPEHVEDPLAERAPEHALAAGGVSSASANTTATASTSASCTSASRSSSAPTSI